MAGGAPGSLRRRLLRWATLSTVAIVCVAAFMSHRQARADVQELIDALLTETAALLLAQAADGGLGMAGAASPARILGAKEPRRTEFAIEIKLGRADGTVLLRTPNAPDTPLGAAVGFADIRHDGAAWRSLVAESADRTLRVEVALPDAARDDEALEIAMRAILPLVLALPLLIGFLYLSVRRGLQPLDDLASGIASRSPDNLACLPTGDAPPEARPLVDALNRLFARVEAVLEGERRFTADAAHELRTPLAALRVHAQLALASQPPRATREALDKVLAGVARATRLVEQLLRLARLDPVARLDAAQPVDLAALAQAAVEEARGAAARTGHTLALDVPGEAARVPGDADLLGVALRNLIDNALRYSPAGTAVQVSVERDRGSLAIVVADAGPGVADALLPRLSERFYRGSDPGADGSGLGLAIVRRVAELHGASLELANRASGGFVARIAWAAACG